jgi:hypothetical protein
MVSFIVFSPDYEKRIGQGPARQSEPVTVPGESKRFVFRRSGRDAQSRSAR